MAKAARARPPDSAMSAQVHRALREGALYVFGALALILWFALFTYDPADPGFSQATSSTEVHNGIGRVGALTADALFNLFGRPAYLFTLMVFYLGWMCIANRRPTELTRTDFFLRGSGFFATLVTSCALSTLHFSPDGFNETAGGIIGQIVGYQLASVMKLLGASVLLFVLWVASISLFLGFSWISVMDRVGRWCLVAYERLRVRIDEWKDRAKGAARLRCARRSCRARRRSKAAETAHRPVIATPEPSTRAYKERQVPLFEPPPRRRTAAALAARRSAEQARLFPRSAGGDVAAGGDQAPGFRHRGRGRGRCIPGPVVTRFELAPAPGVKVSQIAASRRIWRARCPSSACASSRSFPASRSSVSRSRTRTGSS